MQITNEQELLDPAVRKKLIESFGKGASARRKSEAFKAYECLKDHTDHYVIENLLNQFDIETVAEMQYGISNISILRKVIDKLAKVYAGGVKRTIGKSDGETKKLEDAAKVLKVNDALRKTNRYYRVFKNTLLYVRPQKEEDEKMSIRLEVKAPFAYDVIEHPDDFARPLAVILSDYCPERKTRYYLGDAANAGREKNVRLAAPDGDYGGGIVAQEYSGKGQVEGGGGQEDPREFVWWTKSFHFTTNSKGEFVAAKTDESGLNPIGELPFINFCGDQETGFWADGGADLVDAGIAINSMLTNAKCIAVSQGFGQLYMTGTDLPKQVKVGPQHCIQLKATKEDLPPTIGYLNSNPPLADLKAQIEMEVALMLSTNNLSTSGFSTNLGSGEKFASGIAMWIDKSESIEDVNDQAQIFIEKEPMMWGLIGKWHEQLKSLQSLIPAQQLMKLPPVKKLTEIQITFPQATPIQSEGEMLDNLKKRKELGISTEVELIIRDNPSMTEEQAQAKLDKIKAEKKANAEELGVGPDGNPIEEGSGEPGEDRSEPRPGSERPPARGREEQDQE